VLLLLLEEEEEGLVESEEVFLQEG